MTGDLLKRLFEQGEREDAGKPDPWVKLGSAVPEFIRDALAIEPPLERKRIEPPKPSPEDASS
jgi:hypothetical protein